MQTVLSIDISSANAEALIADIDGNAIRILERHNLDISEFLSKISGPKAEIPAEQVTDGSQNIQEENTDTSKAAPADDQQSNPIRYLLSKLNYTWDNAILTIPTQDFISLNIDLPFNDNKNINRILDLEIQDQVPFEIGDFHLCHKSISVSPELDDDAGGVKYDTHVAIISNQQISKIMEICHQASFEPVIVTTPCAALGSVRILAPMYFSDNSMIIMERLPEYYLITCFDGELRTEKIITHPSAVSSSTDSDARKSILMDIKLFVASCEKRYRKNFEKIYYFGSAISRDELQNSIARDVENVKITEFIPLEESAPNIAALASVYADENNSNLIINNFRVKQFSYNQKLKYIFSSSKALLPALGALMLSIVLFFAADYAMNAYKISSLNKAISKQIRNAMPSVSIQNGNELKSLQEENQKLEEQLNDISSLSNITPLDLFLEISKDLPSSLGLSIKSIRIKDNKVIVEGSAEKYDSVVKVNKILQRNPLYQRVKENQNSGISAIQGRRPFSFEIWIKE